jgi:hypothetical protein
VRDLIARLWARLSNPLKAGVSTAVFTFLGLFGASLVGWVQAVVDWAAASGAGEFPSVSVLGKAALSAGGATLVGLLNYVVRELQAAGLLPGSGPTYPSSPPPANTPTQETP